MLSKQRVQKKIVLMLGIYFLTCAFRTVDICSCSRIFINYKGKTIVVTRTMDWEEDDGPELWMHPRGMKVNGKAGKNSLSWTSKYGSLVMRSTKALKDAIVDGINEHGLSVNLLYLEETEYEVRDERPGVSTVQWIHYFVDNFKTVDEAIAGLDNFQLVSVEINGEHHPLHISIEDATGDAAIVEYVNGKCVVYHGAEHTILTNGPAYDMQLENVKKYKGLGGTLRLPGDTGSKDRFVRASYFLSCLPKANCAAEAVAYAFGLIHNVATTYGAPYSEQEYFGVYPTWWMTVADLINKVYYFKSTRNFHTVWVDMKKINFAKETVPMKLDPRKVEYVGEISEKFEQIFP